MTRILVIACCCFAAGGEEKDPLPFTVTAAIQESTWQIDVGGRADLPDQTVLDITVRRLTAIPEENANLSNGRVEMRTMVRDGRFRCRTALDRATALPWKYEIRVACDPARQSERVRDRWTLKEAIASRRSLWIGTSAETRETMAAELARLREIVTDLRRLIGDGAMEGGKAATLATDLIARLASGRERTYFRSTYDALAVVENELAVLIEGPGAPAPPPPDADAPPDPSVPGAADREILGPAGSDPSKANERRSAMKEHLDRAVNAVVREAGALVRQRISEDAEKFDDNGRAWGNALASVMEGLKTSPPFAASYTKTFVREDVDCCDRLFMAFRKAADALAGDDRTAAKKAFEETLHDFSQLVDQHD